MYINCRKKRTSTGGGEGEKQEQNYWDFPDSSSRPLKIAVFYVPFVSLYKQCVFVCVLASPVCLSSCCNPSLCVGTTPPPTLSVCLSVTSAFHFVSVTEPLSICRPHFCSSVSYFNLPDVCLLLPEPGEAQARRRAHGWFFSAPSKWRHFAFHLSVSVSPNPPPVWTFSPSSLTNQSINQNQVSL